MKIPVMLVHAVATHFLPVFLGLYLINTFPDSIPLLTIGAYFIIQPILEFVQTLSVSVLKATLLRE